MNFGRDHVGRSPSQLPSSASSAIFRYISSAFWNVFSASGARSSALDPLAADLPQLLDHPDAPLRALPARPDRLAADDHVHRVGVHLREVPQRHPRTLVDRHLEARSCGLSSAGTSFVADHLAVHDQLDLAVSPARRLPADRGAERQVLRERHLRRHLHRARPRRASRRRTRGRRPFTLKSRAWAYPSET